MNGFGGAGRSTYVLLHANRVIVRFCELMHGTWCRLNVKLKRFQMVSMIFRILFQSPGASGCRQVKMPDDHTNTKAFFTPYLKRNPSRNIISLNRLITIRNNAPHTCGAWCANIYDPTSNINYKNNHSQWRKTIARIIRRLKLSESECAQDKVP